VLIGVVVSRVVKTSVVHCAVLENAASVSVGVVVVVDDGGGGNSVVSVISLIVGTVDSTVIVNVVALVDDSTDVISIVLD